MQEPALGKSILKLPNQDSWYETLSNTEPDIICIHGSYINANILRRLCVHIQMPQFSEWSDSHGNAGGGPEHHNHSATSKVNLEPLNEELMINLKDDYMFRLRKEVKLREEGDYLLLSLGFFGYVINSIGKRLIDFCRTQYALTIKDFKEICKKTGVPEQSGLNFLKRLYIFGLVTFS